MKATDIILNFLVDTLKKGGGRRKVRLALIIFYLKQYTSKIVIKIEKITNRIFNIHFFSSMSSKSNMYLHLEQI